MIFESFLLNFVVALGLIIALTFDYVTKFFTYWYVRHVPYKTPVPFFGSDYHRVLGIRSNSEEVNKLYSQHPKDDLVGSIKSRIPDLTVRDPDLIKKVMSTAYMNFQSRGIDLDKSRDVCIRNNLFYVDGEKWAQLREGFESLTNDMTCTEEGLLDCMLGLLGDKVVQDSMSRVLDGVFKRLLLGFTEDITVITNMRSKLQKRTLGDKFKTYLKNIFPSLYLLFGFETLAGEPSSKTMKAIQRSEILKNIHTHFHFNKDLNKNVNNKPENLEFIILSTFITEGYIPCLNLLISVLFELAKNGEVQKKARNSDEYLEAVINETLRLHPPYPVITRKCVDTYKFPGSNDNNVLVDRGVTINIPVEGLHKDHKYYENADIFNPDRFMNDASTSHNYAFLPFGAGPRKCIGEQLSLQIVRRVVRGVLKKYELEPCHKTPATLPVADHNFGRIISEDIWLKFKQFRAY